MTPVIPAFRPASWVVAALVLLLMVPPLQADPVPSTQTGLASYYHNRFHGRRTASGERHDQNQFMAAHRRLPLGSRVRVTNLDNSRSIEVKINDRGPHGSRKRIIDLSQRAARELGFLKKGLTQVKIEVLELGD